MLLFCAGSIKGQDVDSVKTIEEVTVQAFGQNEQLATAIVRKLDYTPLGNKSSLVNAFNTIPGVRMEERSPGSYRINIRGSSLRSPFGVRNVKVYWGGIPLTDPGGNTYFNQLAYNNFSTVTVFKGPASSMYGAGTGGLVLIDPPSGAKEGLHLEYSGGSYNTHTILADGTWKKDNFASTLTYAHNESDGYREHTAMRRNNVSWSTNMKWKRQELTIALLFSDLYYQTPGALTLKEFEERPGAARPPAGGFPSAMEVNAAIWQKNITAGVTHKQQFNKNWSNATTLYATYAQVQNSAVRNFEKRNEPHFGGRTVFTYNKSWNNSTLQWSTGAEGQQGYSTIRVADNKAGRPDTLRTDDDVNISTYSLFTQGIFSIKNNWVFTAGASVNGSRLVFTRVNDYPVTDQLFRYHNEIAPRFTVLKRFRPVELLATVSRGFSPPTVAEILPSTTIINKDLKAERGWNYELTARRNFSFSNSGLLFEVTGFYFNVNNALVQRRDSSGADYFINAGATRQRGIELFGSYSCWLTGSSIMDYVNLSAGYTYNHFHYGSFITDEADYSGNRLPGVPQSTLNFRVTLTLKPGLYADADYYGAAAQFMNDVNTAKQNAYHLLLAKLGYRKKLGKTTLNVYAGADNLLNETYRLGNDINAAAGRYYNAAPKRNYFIGAAFEWQ